jgi:beta-xylosidase
MSWRAVVWGAFVFVALCNSTSAEPTVPWVPDHGDGTFHNPVLFADYSDPDVVRVGDDFYVTASSFGNVPGLPILHSRDLVNWTIIGHALPRLPERFDTVQHGNGIWAPSLRYHDGWYWIFVGDPDWGILMTRAKHPAGPWEPLHVVQEGKGLIDPCPLWDDDGRAYLVHAYAKSRSGKNSILVAREMSPDGRRLIGEEHLVVDGRDDVHPTIEGPKFYKRNGWYYIFAPAGGVKPGWQMAFRARKPFGPYEGRRVLEQGSTDINGPHQGGWVELANGESWFLHFQDRGAYGRIVHLNPVRWVDDWPEMGVDRDGNDIGEPVVTYNKPAVGEAQPIALPQTSDDFDGPPNLAWQWQANPQDSWSSATARPGWLRLFAQPRPESDLTMAPYLLLQKFPAPEFLITTKLELSADGDATAGLVVMGLKYAGLFVSREAEGLKLVQLTGEQGGQEQIQAEQSVSTRVIWLRVAVKTEALCRFIYSIDGEHFEPLGKEFTAEPGRWIGAKVGLVCLGGEGYVDVDWFRVE